MTSLKWWQFGAVWSAHVIMNKHTHACTHTHLFNLQKPRPVKHCTAKHCWALPGRSCDQNCAYNTEACCDCPTPLLLSWCFTITSTETIRLIKDGERVGGRSGGGGQIEMNNSSKCPGPQRMKRSSATARTTTLRSNLCTSLNAVPTAVRSKVTRTVSEKQLLRNNSAARQTIQLRESSSTSHLLISPGLSPGPKREAEPVTNNRTILLSVVS